MTNGIASFLGMLVISILLDARVRPRPIRRRQWRGLLLHLLVMVALFGLFLAGSGNAPVGAILAVASMAVLTITSNAKYAMLGEPLLFSDLALVAGLVRHPRFYFTAVSLWQRWVLALGSGFLLLTIAWLFVPRPGPHLFGLALLLSACWALMALSRSRAFGALAPVPDVDVDVMRHGVIATLLLYWLRWRETPDPPMCPAVPAREAADAMREAMPDCIVIVQCESFADPAELTGDRRHDLPGLTRARGSAWQWGNLEVSGFGAYTMRTEYGVLFGRSEAALGFRRYDPFLTAQGETSYALPKHFGNAGYRCLFVHPHDMRFYGRDRLMPAMGFEQLIGEEGFAPVQPGERYLDDRTLGASLGDLVDQASKPTFLYAVTMENHGPWDKGRLGDSSSGLDAYLHHLRSSDAMLSGLMDRLSDAGRSALLVFFGDHRPSIPGVVEPGGARHTPYVMLRFARDGTMVTGVNRRVDLCPDELHHMILGCVRDASGPGTQRAADIVAQSGA